MIVENIMIQPGEIMTAEDIEMMLRKRPDILEFMQAVIELPDDAIQEARRILETIAESDRKGEVLER